MAYSIIPQIPCELNRCILYPVCKSKEDISCDDLLKYVSELRKIWGEDNSPLLFRSWSHIRQFLPLINKVKQEYNPTYSIRN